MEFIDYYKVLEIHKTATDKQIKAAYRKLARKHHPDLNPNNKESEKKFNCSIPSVALIGLTTYHVSSFQQLQSWRTFSLWLFSFNLIGQSNIIAKNLKYKSYNPSDHDNKLFATDGASFVISEPASLDQM